MEQVKYILEQKRPVRWEEIPDIDLYMDQVLSYMTRQHAGLELNESLTAAMINNYMKKDLLPRANGKKYNRDHVVYLTAICLLKQVLSVADTGCLLKAQIRERSQEEIQNFYRKYTEMMDEEFNSVARQVRLSDETPDKETLSDTALRLAISSYAQKLACEQILGSLKEDGKEERQGKGQAL